MAKLGPSSGTRCERIVRHYLTRMTGGQWLAFNNRAYPGSPDTTLIFLGSRVAVFTDGRKAARNRRRDYRNNRDLRRLRFHVIRIWDTSLIGRERTARTLTRLSDEINAVMDGKPVGKALRL